MSGSSGSESLGKTQQLKRMTPEELAALTAKAQHPAPASPLAGLIPAVSPNPTPEFSIITCSPPQNEHKFKQMSAIYAQALAGEAYEIIRISDAKGIAEGYNRGVAQARGGIIVFSHDDAAPLRPLATRLRTHLRTVDIVGGAGSDRLDGPAWFTGGPPHVFGQVLNQVPAGPNQPPLLLSIYGVPSALVEKVQAIDGFWMATTLAAARGLPFDEETCDGFHCYDIDWSFRAYLAGLNVGVACDLSLMHASSGGYGDPKWKPAADKFLAKFKGQIADHKPLGFQFAAVHGADINMMLSVMEDLVERTR